MSAQLWWEVLAKIGGTATLVVIVLTAIWQAFKALSSRWLESKFAEKLKRIEQQHDVLVRHLQSSIDREFQRALKLQAKEFDSLVEGWSILHETYWRVRRATGRGYEVHDLAAMGDAQQAEFINKLDFPDWQKQQLREEQQPDQRQRLYLAAWWWKQYADCFDWRTKLVMFIDRNAIFMQPEIKQRFSELYQLVDDALLEFKLRIQDMNAPVNAYNEFARSDALVQGKSVFDQLEQLIHARLWSSTPQATE